MISANDNIWSLTVIGQANGIITISNVAVPKAVADRVREVLEQLGRVRSPDSGRS